MSDLLSNSTRGMLAEFIVGLALNATGEVRDEWASYDLDYENLRVEVKAACQFQAWGQKTLSSINFTGLGKTQSWSRELGQYSGERRRQAEVYVFCLLRYAHPTVPDPLDVEQWAFYVVAAETLERLLGEKRELTLNRLEKIVCKQATNFAGLRDAVKMALNES